MFLPNIGINRGTLKMDLILKKQLINSKKYCARKQKTKNQ